MAAVTKLLAAACGTKKKRNNKHPFPNEKSNASSTLRGFLFFSGFSGLFLFGMTELRDSVNSSFRDNGISTFRDNGILLLRDNDYLSCLYNPSGGMAYEFVGAPFEAAVGVGFEHLFGLIAKQDCATLCAIVNSSRLFGE